MTSLATPEDQNKRILQGVSYLIEWAKHVVTGAAALMVLCATFLKDLGTHAASWPTHVMAVALVFFYLSMLVAVWMALKLVRQCANTVLTTAPQMGSGDDLANLKKHLVRTQRAFVAGLGCFSVVAIVILLSWAEATGTSASAAATAPRASASALPVHPKGAAGSP